MSGRNAPRAYYATKGIVAGNALGRMTTTPQAHPASGPAPPSFRRALPYTKHKNRWSSLLRQKNGIRKQIKENAERHKKILTGHT